MGQNEPPPDYCEPDFSDETGWRRLISERLRAFWPSLPAEFRAEVAAFAQQAFDAQLGDRPSTGTEA